jgi:glycosyltransferase involved in cell wall biosynthesis
LTRVLLVSPFAPAGGAERAFASLARNLPSHGFDPVPVLLERGPLEDWLDGCELVDARWSRSLRPISTARTVADLHRLARRTGARAIVSSKQRGHIVGGPAAAAAGLPAVWWMHDMPPEGLLYRRREPWRRYHVEAIARRIPAARVVCGNDRAGRIQRSRTPGTRVVVIRPGRPLGGLAARAGVGAELRRALGLGGAPIVGVVGRIGRAKGQDLFLEAAAAIARDRPEVRFALVGDAILRTDRAFGRTIARRAEQGRLAGRVLLPGHQDDPVPWLDALDVVVIPSRTEVGPLVLGEALALGKPVVATRVGAAVDVIEHGRNGLLVPPEDPAAIAAAVDVLLGDPELGRALGTAAPPAAQAFCDIGMTRRFASMLEELV